MNRIEAALQLAEQGFYVFPLDTNGKPKWQGWPDKASRDPDKIRKWWTDPVLGTVLPDWIGIYAGKFDLASGKTVSLLVLDVDVKNGRDGRPAFTDLELQYNLSVTHQQSTRSGGRHVVFHSQTPCRNLVNVWPGIDTRGKGGFFVGAGSPGYEGNGRPVAPAPQTLLDHPKLTAPIVAPSAPQIEPPPAPLSSDAALERAMAWLSHATPAVQGAGGDIHTYKIAVTLRDMGVPPHLAAHALVASGWNDRCHPPWGLRELDEKVQNAYRYAQNEVGVNDPARDFTPEQIENPEKITVESINQEFAYVMLGGSSAILWDTRDAEGRKDVKFLSPAAFHDMLAPRRPAKLSRKWMSHPKRRTYHGLVFAPGKVVDPKFYNLWSGFTVTPAARHEQALPEAVWALKAWDELLGEIICKGDAQQALWLKGWLAATVQRPWERPRIATVLRGSKGIGKSIFAETFGALLGHRHFQKFSDDRYLLGSFNAHLESCLMVVLEEAFWGGDRKAEGVLKDLITRPTHPIERKYHETYHVDSFLRIIIIGNEQWVVPASLDERRFAIFEVSGKRKNDHHFFGKLKTGMEHYGGLSFLLRDLLHFDTGLSGLHTAPATEGLRKQKEESLDPFRQWWLDSLIEGAVIGNGLEAEGWPKETSIQVIKLAFGRYCSQRNMRSRIASDAILVRTLQQVVSTVQRRQVNGRNVWLLPPLAECRALWDAAMGGKRDWA